MKIEREQLRTVLKGESVGTATIDNLVVDLPQPMIATTDINYAEAITEEYETEIKYQNPLHEIRERWNIEKIAKIAGSPEAFDQKVEWMETQKDKSLADKFMYTPIIKNSVHITKNTMAFFLRLQIAGGMNLINVVDSPYMEEQQIKEILTNSKKQIADIGQEAFLQVDTTYREAIFSKKRDIAKELEFSGMTAMNSNPMKHFGNYKTLAEMRNDPLMRHLSNVDRIDRADKKSAVMPLAMLFADTFSTKLGMGKGKKLKQGIKPKPRVNVKRYDLETSGHLRISEHRKEHGEELYCMCPICNKNTMEDIVADYHGMLYTAFRVHEPYAIHAFVQYAREQMKAGGLSAFLHNKTYTKNVMTDLFGIGQRAIVQSVV